MSKKASFFAELKRRYVLRAAAFYAASAWLFVQVATQVFPFFAVPNWTVRWIVIASIIGFPFALIFSWFYEWTSQGIQRESEITPNDASTRHSGKRLDRWFIAILSLAVVLLLTNQFVLHHDDNKSADVAPAPAIPSASIAVLPLTNESGDANERYFSDGLTESMITALAQFGGLKLISRNSSFQFRNSKDDAKTIAAKLRVAHLLEGSVRHVGDTVRINATLINAADDSMLWSQHYDRPYKDLFALQDEIANAVAEALKAQLLTKAGAIVQSDRPPGGNVDAYNAYLQGVFYDTRGTEADYRKAIEFYQAAIQLDPRYALAYTGLSIEWMNLARKFLSGAEAQEAYAQARAAADTALALAPNLAAAHRARGTLLESADFNWAGAEAEYRRALQLAPNDSATKTALAGLLAVLGHPDRAVELVRQELASDPLCASCYNWLSSYLSSLGRLDEAEQAIRRAIELQPGHADFQTQLTIITIQRGDAKAALNAARQEIAAGGWQDIALALAQQISGDPAAADAALKTLVDQQANDAGYQIAQVYALRNDPDKVFAWLDRAWANRDAGIGQLLYDPFIVRYQHDPRFAALCRKIGVPPPGEHAAATLARTVGKVP